MRLHLSGFLPFFVSNHLDNIEIPLKEPALLSEILARLDIPVSEIYLTVLNGEPVSLDKTLVSESDEVRLIPPMDGG